MRIIGGTAGSRKIVVPTSVARPSTDRLREALFSILGSRVDGARVLDLFSGSGALGLEAISRGAESCEFVDESKESIAVVRKNIKTLQFDRASVVVKDVFRFLDGVSKDRYDLVFADPPYLKHTSDRDFVAELLEHEKLADALADDALLVIEDFPANKRSDINGWKLLDQRRYGSCGILFYQR